MGDPVSSIADALFVQHSGNAGDPILPVEWLDAGDFVRQTLTDVSGVELHVLVAGRGRLELDGKRQKAVQRQVQYWEWSCLEEKEKSEANGSASTSTSGGGGVRTPQKRSSTSGSLVPGTPPIPSPDVHAVHSPKADLGSGKVYCIKPNDKRIVTAEHCVAPHAAASPLFRGMVKQKKGDNRIVVTCGAPKTDASPSKGKKDSHKFVASNDDRKALMLMAMVVRQLDLRGDVDSSTVVCNINERTVAFTRTPGADSLARPPPAVQTELERKDASLVILVATDTTTPWCWPHPSEKHCMAIRKSQGIDSKAVKRVGGVVMKDLSDNATTVVSFASIRKHVAAVIKQHVEEAGTTTTVPAADVILNAIPDEVKAQAKDAYTKTSIKLATIAVMARMSSQQQQQQQQQQQDGDHHHDDAEQDEVPASPSTAASVSVSVTATVDEAATVPGTEWFGTDAASFASSLPLPGAAPSDQLLSGPLEEQYDFLYEDDEDLRDWLVSIDMNGDDEFLAKDLLWGA